MDVTVVTGRVVDLPDADATLRRRLLAEMWRHAAATTDRAADRLAVAAHPLLDGPLLDMVAADADPAVRALVATNPAVPAPVRARVLSGPGGVRATTGALRATTASTGTLPDTLTAATAHLDAGHGPRAQLETLAEEVLATVARSFVDDDPATAAVVDAATLAAARTLVAVAVDATLFDPGGLEVAFARILPAAAEDLFARAVTVDGMIAALAHGPGTDDPATAVGMLHRLVDAASSSDAAATALARFPQPLYQFAATTGWAAPVDWAAELTAAAARTEWPLLRHTFGDAARFAADVASGYGSDTPTGVLVRRLACPWVPAPVELAEAIVARGDAGVDDRLDAWWVLATADLDTATVTAAACGRVAELVAAVAATGPAATVDRLLSGTGDPAAVAVDAVGFLLDSDRRCLNAVAHLTVAGGPAGVRALPVAVLDAVCTPGVDVDRTGPSVAEVFTATAADVLRSGDDWEVLYALAERWQGTVGELLDAVTALH